MVRHYTKEQRKILFHQLVVLNRPAHTVFLDYGICHGMSVPYLTQLQRYLRNPHFSVNYLSGPVRPCGRPRGVGNLQRQIIIRMIQLEKKMLLKNLRNKFLRYYYGVGGIVQGFSKSTIYRTLVRAGLSHKQVTLRHINRSNIEGLFGLFLYVVFHTRFCYYKSLIVMNRFKISCKCRAP